MVADQWGRYVEMLRGGADAPGGSGDLPDDVLDAMSDAQREQLEELRRAAESLARSDGPEAPPGAGRA